ncbi:2-amino-4-hydroxy-6-hydroxymethyldihydropteridine diphosphokinase [Gammaproteobacteria bacterium]|nr:2-amino-4-hydroxy-6-hydroxymethyldihydropteridine diphosphokinase [Gammaproteobacteria bacterium]MDB9800085.1 2-amino-4-hydroxy-6-hydroxymethyldihydropteridine diphosphokinase [bacterium]
MTIVYIGLGSNLGGDFASPKQNITSAINALAKIKSIQMIKISSFYESKPIGPQDQSDYINAVIKLKTNLDSTKLLNSLQTIENHHGRIRSQYWGPRTLDLDILLFGDQIIHNDRLTIPHTEICNRAFVLVPLSEIEPDCVIPEKGIVSDLVSNVSQAELKVL